MCAAPGTSWFKSGKKDTKKHWWPKKLKHWKHSWLLVPLDSRVAKQVTRKHWWPNKLKHWKFAQLLVPPDSRVVKQVSRKHWWPDKLKHFKCAWLLVPPDSRVVKKIQKSIGDPISLSLAKNKSMTMKPEWDRSRDQLPFISGSYVINFLQL
jgi:hypothetical protein